MKNSLPKISTKSISDKLDNILYEIDIINDRLTYALWENPQWLRNRLLISKIKLQKKFDMLIRE